MTHFRRLYTYFRSRRGLTFTELVVAMMMGSVVALGLATAFVFGIQTWKQALAKDMMHNDGSLAIDKITQMVREAQYTELPPFGGDRLICRGIERLTGSVSDRLEIEWRRGDQALWLDKGFFDDENARLIPSILVDDDDPARVRVTECRFSSSRKANSIFADQMNRDHVMYNKNVAIKVEMTLENDYGDIMHFEQFIPMKNFRSGFIIN